MRPVEDHIKELQGLLAVRESLKNIISVAVNQIQDLEGKQDQYAKKRVLVLHQNKANTVKQLAEWEQKYRQTFERVYPQITGKYGDTYKDLILP